MPKKCSHCIPDENTFSPDFGKKCRRQGKPGLCCPKLQGRRNCDGSLDFDLWRSPQQIFFQALTVASTFLPTEICGKIRPKSDFLRESLSWILALLKPQRFGALGRNVEAASSSGVGGAATNPMTRGLVGEDAPMTRSSSSGAGGAATNPMTRGLGGWRRTNDAGLWLWVFPSRSWALHFRGCSSFSAAFLFSFCCFLCFSQHSCW